MSRPGCPTTEVVLDTVQENPGIHFRGLQRRAGLPSAGQLRHHLDRLMASGGILEVEDGGFVRYFAADAYDRRLRKEMVRLARPLPRRLARLLLRGSMPRTEIRRALRCADSTLGYYLSRLREQGILHRAPGEPYPHYALADPERVREVLEAQSWETGLAKTVPDVRHTPQPGGRPEVRVPEITPSAQA